MQEKKGILLVDNQSENFSRVGKLAEHFGLSFFQAPSENAAIEVLKDERVVLIMAHKDAVNTDHFVKQMRANDRTREVPILLLGLQPESLARGSEDVPLDAIPDGADDQLLAMRFRVLYEWHTTRQELNALRKDHERVLKLNKQIKKFVGNVAHDLRGPLGKLINTSEVLISGVEPEAVQSFYKILSQTSRRGFDLVNDILDIAALESGQVKLQIEPYSMNQLVEQVFSEVEYLASEKEIEVISNLERDYVVRADRNRLFQVVINLVNNAIKFTPRKGCITVKGSVQDGKLDLAVCDTGIGMPKERVAALFKKHEKTTTPGTEGEKGTGFGLALAQEILHAHQSEIVVTSKIGSGSCFSFKLELVS